VEVKWTPSALTDLKDAGDYIGQDNPSAAQAMAVRVQEGVEYLLQHPNLGRAGRVRGTRELVISGSPFVIIYRVRFDQIQVVRVLHHARKWP
jgi:addiction module RelE/StbE family toxin